MACFVGLKVGYKSFYKAMIGIRVVHDTTVGKIDEMLLYRTLYSMTGQARTHRVIGDH